MNANEKQLRPSYPAHGVSRAILLQPRHHGHTVPVPVIRPGNFPLERNVGLTGFMSSHRGDRPAPYAGIAVWGGTPKPVGMNHDCHWEIFVYGQKHLVPVEMIQMFESYDLKDVLLNSLAPLTHQYSRSEMGRIRLQAATFFSAFDPRATWDINVDNLPHKVGRVINGVTSNARRRDIGSRFMRFRFPHIMFETSPLGLPECFCANPNNLRVKSIWKAWARGGPTSGIVAYGTMYDNIQMSKTENGRPLFKILSRNFEVIQVLQPEILAPMPYPAQAPPDTDVRCFLVMSTSWTVIRFLRKSEKVMTFLISLSALLAALQPIASNYNDVVGWILAGVGILSGFTSVLAVLTSWALGWIEANTARRRQYREN